MNNTNVTRNLWAISIVFAAALGVWAAQPWVDKPYTQWNLAETQRILSDSPWVRRVTVDQGGSVFGSSPGMARSAPDERVYREKIEPPPSNPASAREPVGLPTVNQRHGERSWTVAWVSSLTYRQAVVRQRLLRGEGDTQRDNDYLSANLDYYVVAVTGGLPNALEDLQAASYIQPGSSGEKIHPFKVELEHVALETVLYFPRQLNGRPILAPGEKKVRFVCKIKQGDADLKIEAKFDLRKMVRDGKPDL